MKIILGLLFYSNIVFALMGPTKEVVVDYKYEINTAPAAFIANWTSLDILKYDKYTSDSDPNAKLGYGVAVISYLRNNNDFDNTFPSRKGYAVGVTAVLDYKENYFGSHAFYEKYERYQSTGSMAQEREGFRANVIIGGKEFFKKNYAVKFGWGIELQTYKIREFDEVNRLIQNNYYTTILNPFYFELKLAGLF